MLGGGRCEAGFWTIAPAELISYMWASKKKHYKTNQKNTERHNNCVRRRRTLPNLVRLLWTLAKALRVFLGFLSGGQLWRHIHVAQRILPGTTQKFCLLREHRVLAYVLLKNFVAAVVFSISYFLTVVEEFRSWLSKPEGSVCHFGLSIGQSVMTAVCYIFGFHY